MKSSNESNLDAAGLFASFGTQVPLESISYYQPKLVIPLGHWCVCPNCTGPLGVSKRDAVIHVGFGRLPDSVEGAEKILAKKALRCGRREAASNPPICCFDEVSQM